MDTLKGFGQTAVSGINCVNGVDAAVEDGGGFDNFKSAARKISDAR